jgi:hypothetical protein
MNITVDTKFNIGDMVYAADCYYDYYPRKIPYTIYNIWINVDAKQDRIITKYGIKSNDDEDIVLEGWIFATYEECVQWCQKHNVS